MTTAAFRSTQVTPLSAGWQLAHTPAGAAESAGSLGTALEWIPCTVPATAASALRAQGQWDLDHAHDFDADDWWFRCEFAAPKLGAEARHTLCFDGLATIADVWLNGKHLLSSANMWVAHRADVTGALRGTNELVIRCASLTAALGARRPRPRWRTRLVEQQQLRWFRTTLLGRMPGWSPPVAPVGPWRDVRLESWTHATMRNVTLRPSLLGDDGALTVAAEIALASGAQIRRASIDVAGTTAQLAITPHADGATVAGQLAIRGVAKWWPHTHGTPTLHEVRMTIETSRGDEVIALGRTGFRSIDADGGTDGRGFALRVNGVRVFARGACWAPLDIATIHSAPAAYRAALERSRDAGFNMIRIGGTMAYEADAFHETADELGILVWQDFMFANMDYPAGDPDFASSVRVETASVLSSLGGRPSLAVLCGGSEVAQQAAMLGLPAETWSSALTDELLPAACAEHAPGVPYVTNSPSGGVLPFRSDEGIAHYFGVGAYLRPVEDARRASVRFATECLGFANVPDLAGTDLVSSPAEPAPHHPRWKARVPRDRGAGWDFDDVRDHYFRVVFGVDPLAVRYADSERYLAMSRVVSGEIMSRVIAEWRRPSSPCAGALVWTHHDMWPGAGWGVFDASGNPKAACRMLARACAPLAVLVTDEGVNGLAVHLVNDRRDAVAGELEVCLWRDRVRVGDARRSVQVAGYGALTVSADEVLGRFTDISYSHRFGPPGHDMVTVTLRDAHDAVLGEAFHFPSGLPASVRPDVGVTADTWQTSSGAWMLGVRTDGPAIAIAIEIPGFEPADAYFHLAPGSARIIALAGNGTEPRPSGSVFALNAYQPVRVVTRDAAPEWFTPSTTGPRS